jgi:hypothetical protein
MKVQIINIPTMTLNLGEFASAAIGSVLKS